MTTNFSDLIQGLLPGEPDEAAQAGLREWHRIVATEDWESLQDLLSDDVAVLSPPTDDAFSDNNENIIGMLGARCSVVKDFTYLRHYARSSGYVIEFSGTVADDRIIGFDLVEFNPQGKINSLMIMMRPARMVVMLSSDTERHSRRH